MGELITLHPLFTEEDKERLEWKFVRTRQALLSTPQEEGKAIFVDFKNKTIQAENNEELRVINPTKKRRSVRKSKKGHCSVCGERLGVNGYCYQGHDNDIA